MLEGLCVIKKKILSFKLTESVKVRRGTEEETDEIKHIVGVLICSELLGYFPPNFL